MAPPKSASSTPALGSRQAAAQPSPKLKKHQRAATANGLIATSAAGDDAGPAPGSIDTDVPVEEHFILRLPPRLSKQLQPGIKARNVPSDFALSFIDGRRGVCRIGKESFQTHLVDLPCVIESLKTIDNKQFYKIADVSQMLLVQDSGSDAAHRAAGKDGNWPHGLSQVLHNVRARRFRKRMNKKTIEDVEAEVERLLLADLAAEETRWELHERREAEESLFDEDDFMQSEAGETAGGDTDDFDALLDAELAEPDGGPEDSDDSDSDEDEDEDEDEGAEEELDKEGDGTESGQLKTARHLLSREINELNRKVEERTKLAEAQVNPIMKRRFNEIVAKLTAEMEIKQSQLDVLDSEIVGDADV